MDFEDFLTKHDSTLLSKRFQSYDFLKFLSRVTFVRPESAARMGVNAHVMGSLGNENSSMAKQPHVNNQWSGCG